MTARERLVQEMISRGCTFKSKAGLMHYLRCAKELKRACSTQQAYMMAIQAIKRAH